MQSITFKCARCGLQKPIEERFSKQRCIDCASHRICWSCRERKPIVAFPQETSKGCSECLRTGRAKKNKAANAKRRYSENRRTILNRNARWKRINSAKYREQQARKSKEQRTRATDAVLRHYGGRCDCCGESEPLFLSIDHIDGNGGLHRRMVGRANMWVWLFQNDFPPGFRLLCFNCNTGRYRNGGRCPHER